MPPEPIDLLSVLEEDAIETVEVIAKSRMFKCQYADPFLKDLQILHVAPYTDEVQLRPLTEITLTEQGEALDSSPFIERRLGNFSVPIEWLEGMATKHFREIFKHFRIVRAELDYATQSMQYVAASDYFDEVPKGQMPGSYAIQIDAGEPITIRVNRVG